MRKNFLKHTFLGILCVMLISFLCACKTAEKTKEKEAAVSCTISVSCEEILRHMDELKEEKKALVPEDGMILEETEVTVQGTSAFEILETELKKKKIHFDKTGNYIKAIGNLYEKDCGTYSGWIYTVNGEYVEVSADAYYPKDRDNIEWSYMTGLE